MPVIFQKHIVREDLRRNPGVLYVFGDNMVRKGYGGQAKEMRNEPNSVGVATKYSPYDRFTSHPVDIVQQQQRIDDDMKKLFAHVKRGGIVVWPSNGIGTGLADLPNSAPETFDYLQQKLAALLKAADLFALSAHEN